MAIQHPVSSRRRRVQTKGTINNNDYHVSSRYRSTGNTLILSFSSTAKLIFLVCHLAALLSPGLGQHHQLRDGDVCDDESEYTVTFDINSHKPQIQHYTNSRAGSILARGIPLASSECDNDKIKTVAKRRLVAFDLDPIFPPYDNAFEELFVILESDNVKRDHPKEDARKQSPTFSEKNESNNEYKPDYTFEQRAHLMEEIEDEVHKANIESFSEIVEEIEVEVDKANVEIVSAVGEDKTKIDTIEVIKGKDEGILAITGGIHVLENVLSNSHDDVISANKQNKQIDAAKDKAAEVKEIEMNDDNKIIDDPISGRPQSPLIISDLRRKEEDEVEIQETSVISPDPSSSSVVPHENDVVGSSSMNRDGIDDAILDSQGGYIEVIDVRNFLEDISSDSTPEISLRGEDTISKATEENENIHSLLTKSEGLDEPQDIQRNPTLLDKAKSADFRETHESAIDNNLEVKKTAMVESQEVKLNDNKLQQSSAENPEETLDLSSTNLENKSAQDHYLLRKDEIHAHQEIILDDQNLASAQFTSTGNTLVQEDEGTNETQESIVDAHTAGSVEPLDIDEMMTHKNIVDLFRKTVVDDQIPDKVESASKNETLALEDDSIGPVDETSLIPGSIKSGNRDETLKDRNDRVINDGIVHDHVLASLKLKNKNETLEQKDDDIALLDDTIANGQLLDSIKSVNNDETWASDFDPFIKTKKEDPVTILQNEENISDNDGVDAQDDLKDQKTSHKEASTKSILKSVAASPNEAPITSQHKINKASEITEDTLNNDPTTLSANDNFVQGLDDIDKFMENVEPPDELDAGGGKSIQEVLMSQGVQIIKTRVQKGMNQVKKSASKFKRKTAEGLDSLKSEGKKNEDNLKKFYEDNNRIQFAVTIIEKQKKNIRSFNKVFLRACIKVISKVRVCLQNMDLMETDDGTGDLDDDFSTYRKVTIGDEELAKIRKKAMEKETGRSAGIDADGSTAQGNVVVRNRISDEVQEKVRKQYNSNNLKSNNKDNNNASETKI